MKCLLIVAVAVVFCVSTSVAYNVRVTANAGAARAPAQCGCACKKQKLRQKILDKSKLDPDHKQTPYYYVGKITCDDNHLDKCNCDDLGDNLDTIEAPVTKVMDAKTGQQHYHVYLKGHHVPAEADQQERNNCNFVATDLERKHRVKMFCPPTHRRRLLQHADCGS
jgi:hypothetical protein